MNPKSRFESKIERIPISGCWIWMAACKTGRKWPYGTFWLNGTREGAHRASWMLFRGDIPKGRFICHSCDIPSCVNPDHLFIGDAASNMADMISKGRDIEGRKQRAKKMAKLTPEQVKYIREAPLSFGKFAKQFGVSRGCIQHIKQGRTHAHS